jgi:hypothetical protein
LQRQTEAVRSGHTALDLPESVNDEPEPPKNNDLLLLLPAWLRRNKEVEKKGAAEDRLNRLVPTVASCRLGIVDREW